MIPELGQFTLIMALGIAIVQTILPIIGAQTKDNAWMNLARPTANLQFVFIIFSFAMLTWSFIQHDFSVLYVAKNSNSLLPIMYRISAVWGGHEGSLLLWALILSGWTVAVGKFSNKLPLAFVARVIGVMGSISIGFLLFMLLTSNPFDRIFPSPLDGQDLNPLLQDPGLIIHPPMLYMGYVGFSVGFGFAIAALLGGTLDSVWARWARPWIVMAWVFLTIGIALGSWWAYYELGWGGWWFWDPVENASFMPWLVGIALIHSLAATDKRDIFKNWTVLLAICAFALSLLGTFLVRSGVLTSVHAFATDPTRGVFILALLVFYIGGALMLYAWRAPRTLKGSGFNILSRETFLLFNSIFLLVAMLTVLLGTLYPLIIDVLGVGKISVGAPYFNAVFIPLMMPVVVLMGIGSLIRWHRDSWSRISKKIFFISIISLLLAICIVWLFVNHSISLTLIGVFAALWIIFTSLFSFYERLANTKNKLTGLINIPRSFYGMTIAHIGFAISIVGITVTSNHSADVHKRISPNDTIEFAGYKFLLDRIENVEGSNYSATQAVIKVTKKKQQVATLYTQKRLYKVRSMPMTEAGIDAGFTRDLYASLGEPLDKNSWSIRIYYKAFIRWIWLGAIFMAIGGILAATDKRYRLRLNKT